MKSAYATVLLSIFSHAALAAPAGTDDASTTDDRQTKLIKAFNDGMSALGFSSGIIKLMDEFIKDFTKRDEIPDHVAYAVRDAIERAVARA
ncbi:hypothetical protein E4U43_000779 [Claviceps pusilla]|uniref:Uncharacterized protein n=1 Tax=Claviceps pusilla TaxID=123648 RepID=A0A9P7SZS0_9HYPO|nr:hypothetical protein E4U43_000779 [Claviceps pusilla]